MREIWFKMLICSREREDCSVSEVTSYRLDMGSVPNRGSESPSRPDLFADLPTSCTLVSLGFLNGVKAV
jgi:hypothetical protein